jgi:hypothetical protein
MTDDAVRLDDLGHPVTVAKPQWLFNSGRARAPAAIARRALAGPARTPW